MTYSRTDSAVDLVADIGGTNARFCLADADKKLLDEMSFAVAEYAAFEDALDAYLVKLGSPRPRRAALAVASPLTGDLVQITNSGWSFSAGQVQRRYGFERLLVLNDFSALAHALPFLAGAHLHRVGGGQAAANAPMGVIGPGTGLGVSGLIPTPAGWVALQGEGGHCTFSPANAHEAAILAIMQREFPHVSFERLVSGMGLSNLYRATIELAGGVQEPLTPAEITSRAIAESDPICSAALETFCAILGTVAGDLALTIGARGGIFIGGGIVPRLGAFFDHSGFRRRFEDKGRFASYLAAIPTSVIRSSTPALVGAAHALAAA